MGKKNIREVVEIGFDDVDGKTLEQIQKLIEEGKGKRKEQQQKLCESEMKKHYDLRDKIIGEILSSKKNPISNLYKSTLDYNELPNNLTPASEKKHVREYLVKLFGLTERKPETLDGWERSYERFTKKPIRKKKGTK